MDDFCHWKNPRTALVISLLICTDDWSIYRSSFDCLEEIYQDVFPWYFLKGHQKKLQNTSILTMKVVSFIVFIGLKLSRDKTYCICKTLRNTWKGKVVLKSQKVRWRLHIALITSFATWGKKHNRSSSLQKHDIAIDLQQCRHSQQVQDQFMGLSSLQSQIQCMEHFEVCFRGPFVSVTLSKNTYKSWNDYDMAKNIGQPIVKWVWTIIQLNILLQTVNQRNKSEQNISQ